METNREKIAIDAQALQKALTENMKKIKHKIMIISGKGGGEKAAMDLNVPFLGRIPIQPEVVESTDSGKPLLLANKESPVTTEMKKIVDKLIKQLSLNEKKAKSKAK